MSRPVLNGLDLNSKQINNLADPSAGGDAANKQYVDAVAAGRDWKESARVASTANVTLSGPGATINGVTMAANDRVLLKNQTASAENGIWVWNGAASAMTRATDAANGTQLNPGATIAVTEGTVDPDTRWTLTTDGAITVGTTSQTWSKDAGGAAGKAAGAGLTEDASNYNIGQGTGISVTADAVAIDTAVVARKFSASCVVTTNPQTFTHNLGTKDVSVTVRRNSDDVHVEADVVSTDVNNVTVNFGGAPTAAQYRVTVIG